MNRNILKIFVVSVFALSCLMAPLAMAALEEGMTQGEFSLWLVQAVGAMYKLPPGADGEDAIVFLSNLGVIPQNDWQRDEKISKEFLASLLDLPEDEKKALIQDANGFDKLVEKVQKAAQSRFDNARQGVFRVQSATPSVPA